MQYCSQPLKNLDDVRAYVKTMLCEFNALESGAFPLTERGLFRAGRRCGVYFCLHGPRAVKFTAIWELEKNRILFYGASGERFLKVQLADAPDTELAVA